MIRLTERSIVYGTRSHKRFAIFVVAFIVLSLLTIMSIHNLNTDAAEFLEEEKAIVLKQTGWNSANAAAGVSAAGIVHSANGVAVTVNYLTIDMTSSPSCPDLRIFSIDANSWACPLVKPNKIVEGRFVEYPSEGIILQGFRYEITAGARLINQSIEVGSYFTLMNGATAVSNIHIVGEFRLENPKSIVDPANNVWMFVHKTTFDQISASMGLPVFTYSVTYIASGATILRWLMGDAYANLREIKSDVDQFEAANTAIWDVNPVSLETKESTANLKEMLFMIGFFGGIAASTIYAYLISRFRRREVAVLKAIGFSNGNVRIVMLAEIITVSVLGFAVGLISLQLWFVFSTTNTAYTPNLIGLPTTWFSFMVVAISNILGYLMISMRTGSVRPVELFRGE